MGSEQSTGGLTLEKFGSLGKYHFALVSDFTHTNLDVRIQRTRSIWRDSQIPSNIAICVSGCPCNYLRSADPACRHRAARKQKPSGTLSFLNSH